VIEKVVCPEEDRAGENATECFLQSAVMRSVRRHAPFDEDFARAAEPDDRRPRADSSSRQPKEGQPILSERNTVIGMTHNLKKEASVPSSVFQRLGRKPPAGQTAEDERTSAE